MTERETQPPSRAAERLRDGLRREREIYSSLVEISARQGEIIAGGRTDELLALARHKEEVLRRIEETGREVAQLKAGWPGLRESIGGPLRRDIEEELAGIESVLRRLIELENQGRAGMDELHRETAQKIQHVEGGRRMQKAYRSPRPPRFLDRSE